MRQIIAFLFLQLLFLSSFSQKIKEIQAYSKLGTTRIIALTEDNEAWFYTNNHGWSILSSKELPDGEIKFLDVYHSIGGSKLMAVMEDNSIWKYEGEDEWSNFTSEGLPANYNIIGFKPYSKYKMMGFTDGRAIIQLADNSLWRFSENDQWDKLTSKGVPEGATFTKISTYQEVKMMGFKTRFIASLNDNSLISYGVKDKKWETFATKELPKDASVVALDSYLKVPLMGIAEGRVIVTLSDQSIWWASGKDERWNKLEVKGLPEGYKIKTIKVFLKGTSARVLVLLEDSTIWWYADEEGFSQVDTKGLGK